MRPEKLLERPLVRGENMVDANNQNALYVVDSSGKLNLVDAQNRESFVLAGKCQLTLSASFRRSIPTQQPCDS